jgi:hypothetical protein
VFFLGGILAPYIAGLGHGTGAALAVPRAAVRGSDFSVAIALCVAVATTLAFLVMNVCKAGFTDALERMKRLEMISFTPEGFRNTQILQSVGAQPANSVAKSDRCQAGLADLPV